MYAHFQYNEFNIETVDVFTHEFAIFHSGLGCQSSESFSHGHDPVTSLLLQMSH